MTKNPYRNQKREIEESLQLVNLGTDFRNYDHVPQEQKKKKSRERKRKKKTQSILCMMTKGQDKVQRPRG